MAKWLYESIYKNSIPTFSDLIIAKEKVERHHRRVTSMIKQVNTTFDPLITNGKARSCKLSQSHIESILLMRSSIGMVQN